MKYDPDEIEKRWQAHWNEHQTFSVEDCSNREKYFVLDMFPYPSGAGLHVGHLIGYTATDIIARYKSAKGFAVLHPMGWDSFGLPAEQYAIRTGTHPAVTTDVNIRNFKEQLKSMGYAYDWNREIRTSDPKFYKWTQWIFTKLYEKGLAYQADMMVNWCPALKAVLANEEIEEGRSVEGGHPVEKRPLRQWVLKITDYADRLLDDLDELDWPHGLKKLQENWIGRSEGTHVHFPAGDEKVSVFTTRHDTIFGVTFLVLAPEHPLVEKVTSGEQKEAIAAYQKAAASKSDLERAELEKEKSGVFTGGYAINPVNGEKLPIWIADYVLMSYGTGAVMGVPGHDSRDAEFVEKYGLEKRQVVDEGVIINSKSDQLDLNGKKVKEAKELAAAWLEKSGYGERTINYKLRDWLFSRQRYWGEPIPVLHFEDGSMRTLNVDELPLLPPEVEEYKPSETGESPLAKVREWVEVEDGGQKALRETNTMPQWGGSCWYYLRYIDPQNEHLAWDPQKEKYWMPIDLYVGGAEHAVLHLLYARFWHKVLYDLGLVSTKEPFKKLCNQGLIVARAFQKREGGYVDVSEVVEKDGRFCHWESGEELVSSVEKMSKSKLNGVSPTEVIEEFGADALRLYCMFMGPIDKEKVWNTDSVGGCRRFLNRFFEMCTSDKVQADGDGLKLGHRLIDGVERDIEQMQFNTAISKMMIFINEMIPQKSYSKEAILMAIQALAPFAPHMAEELWIHLGQKSSVAHAPWPAVDKSHLEDESVTYVVQVNGRVRERFELAKGCSEQQLMELAQKSEQVTKHLTGKIVKVIFVPNKLLNIVVK
ncbi:MAG: leucine--tRNA ligase [Chlamydiae bacterium]|nr:leucine--tRNA ligase [Chlamydiota bacterium]